MDTDSFVIHIKTKDFHKDNASDDERQFDSSNYDEKDKRPLPIGKNRKVIGIFKEQLGGINFHDRFLSTQSKSIYIKIR